MVYYTICRQNFSTAKNFSILMGPSARYGLKYRLYYGLADSTCTVRYDNETGKGDHRHEGDREEPYSFTDVETLVADFLADIARVRKGGA